MNHDANTLHRSETNGGDRKSFPKSETRNFDRTCGQTACIKRFRKSFDGPIIPVGAKIRKRQVKIPSRLIQNAEKDIVGQCATSGEDVQVTYC